MECCFVEKLPVDFTDASLPDQNWDAPEFLEHANDPYGTFSDAAAQSIGHTQLDVVSVGKGLLMRRFGYEYDDIPAGFYLCSLALKEASEARASGFRYDLRKICLFLFEAESRLPPERYLKSHIQKC